MMIHSLKSSAARSYTRGGRTLATAASTSLRINSDRLQETLHETCKWGAANPYGAGATETGMNRLALTDLDLQARNWFTKSMQDLGCTVTLDTVGNMFARKQGSAKSPLLTIAMGSHLDTQPRGGRYDGILGVVAAVEAMRTMQDHGYQTHFDVGVVNWTNEEGARFPRSMMGSGVWSGMLAEKEALELQDIFDPSKTVQSELERLGLAGSVPASSEGYPLGAHFELHIEQGPILESQGKAIGIVQGSQGYKWLTVHVKGRDAHTGTTPLYTRQDPILASAKMIASAHAIAKSHGALASTGIVKIPKTSSTNTIAAEAWFSLDIRHPDDAVVASVYEQVLASFDIIAKEDGRGVEYSHTVDTDSPATKFDKDCITAVRRAAKNSVGEDSCLDITSGAGHDSVLTSRCCPTTMIFVPCKDGVSHHPEEYCAPQDCANGAQVLLDAVIGYDRFKATGNWED